MALLASAGCCVFNCDIEHVRFVALQNADPNEYGDAPFGPHEVAGWLKLSFSSTTDLTRPPQDTSLNPIYVKRCSDSGFGNDDNIEVGHIYYRGHEMYSFGPGSLGNSTIRSPWVYETFFRFASKRYADGNLERAPAPLSQLCFLVQSAGGDFLDRRVADSGCVPIPTEALERALAAGR